MGIFDHREQIVAFHENWDQKPALRAVYGGFYRLIRGNLSELPNRRVIELGSGIGSIKDVIPECITTDMFPTPWNEKVENAYFLSFPDRSISDIILVDVFHHLEFPGSALEEFNRVLRPGGKVLLFEPCLSVLGLFVYGMIHHEPISIMKQIVWKAPESESLDSPGFYAAQGSATRIFLGGNYKEKLNLWHQIKIIRLSALSYLASGGYRKPQLLPDRVLPFVKIFEGFFDLFPTIFATRMLVILTKEG
jgi:SAM-dependent methyltransferase